MKTSTVLAAIEAVRPSVQEDAAVYFYPLIPEEVLNVHKKKYLDLEPDEKVLVLVNQKSGGFRTIFSGFCITDKRLIVRVENGSVLLGDLTSIFRETASIPLEEIATIETMQNLNATARIIVNGQYLGLIYQDSCRFLGLNKSNNHTFEAIDALFKAMLQVAATEDTPTIVDKDWAKRYKNSRKSMIAKYFIEPIRHHYCDFKGTASQAEFWYFILFYTLIVGAIGGLFTLFSATAGTIINSILSLVFLLPSLGITVRRLHDIGKKGTMIFVSFIPLAGAIWLLVLLCKPSVIPIKKQRSSFNLSDIVISVICGAILVVATTVALVSLEDSSDYDDYDYTYTEAVDDTDDKNIAEIESAVKKIYKDAFSSRRSGDLEKKYFSKELYKLWENDRKKDMPNIDWDIWTLSQDSNNPRMIVKSIDKTNEGDYFAILTIRDYNEQEIVLFMVKERRKWVINDMVFLPSYTFLSELLKQ